jgi:hypothetical protein
MKPFLLSILGIITISATILMNIYSSLNISEDQAKESLLTSIVQGYIMRNVGSEDLVDNARQLSVDEQVEGMKQLMKMAKEYTASEAFKKDYKKARNEKLNPGTKSKLGIPKLGKMLDKKIDNTLDKSENDKNYPPDPVDMVKKRLTDFLEISSTVDFDAEVKDNRFVKPEYEKKNGWWKMCFRAGKPVIEAAREEAQKWLDELNSK